MITNVNLQKIIDITIDSANAKSKEIYIYENSNLSELIGFDKAEEIRNLFLENNIRIKQITNSKDVEKFTIKNNFVDKCMDFRYIPENIFAIKQEILIFDDQFYMYSTDGKHDILHIQNKIFANNQKELFMSLWADGILPNLKFPYLINNSFFESFSVNIDSKLFICYADIEAKKSWNIDKSTFELYLANLYSRHKEILSDGEYYICFLWSDNTYKMMDIWKFKENTFDDRSGPLNQAYIFKNLDRLDLVDIGSGNTIMVLGYEEKARRQSKDIADYLNNNRPKLPFGICNDKQFFDTYEL